MSKIPEFDLTIRLHNQLAAAEFITNLIAFDCFSDISFQRGIDKGGREEYSITINDGSWADNIIEVGKMLQSTVTKFSLEPK